MMTSSKSIEFNLSHIEYNKNYFIFCICQTTKVGGNKHLVRQLISAKGTSLLFHYGSNLTSFFSVQPLKQQKTAAVASLRYRMKVYLSGRGLHFFFVILQHSFITSILQIAAILRLLTFLKIRKSKISKLNYTLQY